MLAQKRILIGLVGTNILASLAPALHEDALAAAGADGHYHLMDLDVLKDRSLADIVQAVRTAGFAGINVTHPFKEAVVPLLDQVSPQAREIGAVNTVVIDREGRTTGHNTDRIGFYRGFEEALGRDSAQDRTVVLIGAGGAGRAVAFALMDHGVADLQVHDVNPGRAAALCADLAVHFGPQRCRVAAELSSAAQRAAGIVNATPTGMHGYPGLPLAGDLLQPGHWVADIIYSPLETEFLKLARDKGCRTMNGGGMCVHQAAEAYRLFTGREADVARMHHTFEKACARRG
jgi:shikimate dehydrogenase